MKLHRLKLRSLASPTCPWREEEAVIDFDAAGDGLVALTGPNGAGKTTAMEASGPGVLFREFPYSAETFAQKVTTGARDGHAEITFTVAAPGEKPRRLRAMVQADPQFGGGRGKTEAYLWDDETQEKLAGPLVTDFADAVARFCPPPNLFYASVFTAQGGGGSFFAMPKAARKDLFVRMLGLEHLQALSERARERAQAAAGELEAARAELAKTAPRIERARELVMYAKETASTIQDREAVAKVRQVELDTANLRAADAERARTAALLTNREMELARRAAQDRLTAATQAHTAATARNLRLRQTIAAAGDVEAAVALVTALEPEAQTHEAAVLELDTLLQAMEGARRDMDHELEMLRERRRQIQEKLTTAREATVNSVGLERFERDLSEQEATAGTLAMEVDAARELYLRAEREAETAQTHAFTHMALITERDALAKRTGLLEQIDVGNPMCNACPLTQDAQAADARIVAIDAELADLPAFDTGAAGLTRVEAAEAYEAKRAATATQARLIADTRNAIANLTGNRALAAGAEELEGAMSANTLLGQATLADRDGLVERLKQHGEKIQTARASLGEIRSRLEVHRATAARAGEIRAAQDEQETVLTELASAELDVRGATGAIEAIGEPADMEPLVAERDTAVDVAEQILGRRDLAHEALQEARTDLSRIEGELAGLGTPESDAALLREREGVLVEAHATWALLERGLGRDGVQALEIDAAGPGVTAIVNDLLSTCYGPRFQIAIETTAPKKDGGQKEVFDIRILDGEAGRQTTKGSGGEQALVDEALRLGLAIYNTQRSGYDLRTLWRDESLGPLDQENASRYIAMLRRAAQIGGFPRIYFIAHDDRVWAQADARICITREGIQIQEGAA